MIDRIRMIYGAFTASCDCRTVSKFARNTNRVFTLEYCAKTGVYGAILKQNGRFQPIYGSLRRSVMIDLGRVDDSTRMLKNENSPFRFRRILGLIFVNVHRNPFDNFLFSLNEFLLR